jgi:nucleoid-associated protein YgaU
MRRKHRAQATCRYASRAMYLHRRAGAVGKCKAAVVGQVQPAGPGLPLRRPGAEPECGWWHRAGRMEEYVVVSGDSLSKIGQKYGVSWKQIYEANRDQIKNPDLIQPGWRLKIPKA